MDFIMANWGLIAEVVVGLVLLGLTYFFGSKMAMYKGILTEALELAMAVIAAYRDGNITTEERLKVEKEFMDVVEEVKRLVGG